MLLSVYFKVKAMDWNAKNLTVETVDGDTEADTLISEFDAAINELHTDLELAQVTNFSAELH
jgi:hypothetical protein